MSRLDIQIRIKALRDELENRHKNGIVKIADANGKPVPTKNLQDEMFSLILKLSRLDKYDD